MEIYDAIVIGAGSAGYSFALTAANLGWKVLLVEKDTVGGTCLNRGCIPTKALLKLAKFKKELSFAKELGFTNTNAISHNFKTSHSFKENIVERMYKGLSFLIKNNKNITLINGLGEVDLTNSRIVINKSYYSYKKLILATGRTPIFFPNYDSSIKNYILTSDSLLKLKKIPNSLTILGGGSIGCEFASLFNSLGTKVTVIEYAKHLLANADSVVSKKLESSFEKAGIQVNLDTKVLKIESTKDSNLITINCLIENQKSLNIQSEYVLSAIGREIDPVPGIDIKHLMDHEDIFSEVYENVYCIGDILKTPQLAHVAYKEGISLAKFLIKNIKENIQYKYIPSITYCIPEIATVGYTEEEAKTIFSKDNIEIKEYELRHNAKALIDDDGDAYVKMILKNKQIIGVHIISKKASDLITEAGLITNWEADAEDLAKIIHPHPTESEFYSEIALSLTGTPLHLK